MYEIILGGCAVEPLMGYLKALGIFRLVAEQADSEARLFWSGRTAVLLTRLAGENLTDFLLADYEPTPLLAPWNSGSGFYSGACEPLEKIAASRAPRLASYRKTISEVRTIVPSEKPKDERKYELLVKCRAILPDTVVPWLDVCFVLGEAGASFFPLLGTGGNDGRLDFTNNLFQRLADVISFGEGNKPPANSAGWLHASLFADSYTPLCSCAIGQFNPGGIGGANGVQGHFYADSRSTHGTSS